MGLKKLKIFIIFEEDRYSKTQILEDLESEEFSHFFKFDCDLTFFEESQCFIADADEVWTFGEVEHTAPHVFAKDIGKDIWKMG